jgi:hypothetical protein
MYHSLELRRQLAQIERELLLRGRRDRIESWGAYGRAERLTETTQNLSPATASPPNAPMPA